MSWLEVTDGFVTKQILLSHPGFELARNGRSRRLGIESTINATHQVSVQASQGRILEKADWLPHREHIAEFQGYVGIEFVPN